MTVLPEQTARTLRQRAQAAQQDQLAHARRTRDIVVQRVRSLLGPNGRAWLIGSLAWGGFGERSDVDLVFYGVPSEVTTEIELALTRELRREVDLLQLDDLGEPLRQRILEEGIALHAQ
jgi:predicted nucleotidyltransferase